MLTIQTNKGSFDWWLGQHFPIHLEVTKITADGDELMFLIDHHLIENNKELSQSTFNCNRIIRYLKFEYNSNTVIETEYCKIEFDTPYNISNNTVSGYGKLYRKVKKVMPNSDTYGDFIEGSSVQNEVLNLIGTTYVVIPISEILFEYKK